MSRSQNEKTPREKAFDQTRALLKERLAGSPQMADIAREYYKQVVTPIRDFLQEQDLDPNASQLPGKVVPFLKEVQEKWKMYSTPLLNQPGAGVTQFLGFYRDMGLYLIPNQVSIFDQELWQMILSELPKDPESN